MVTQLRLVSENDPWVEDTRFLTEVSVAGQPLHSSRPLHSFTAQEHAHARAHLG